MQTTLCDRAEDFLRHSPDENNPVDIGRKEQIEPRYSGSIIHIIVIKLIDTRENAKALVIEQDGTEVRLNSAYRPLSEAKSWAEQYAKKSGPFLMLGLGNGLFVREMLRVIGSGAGIIILEPKREVLEFCRANCGIDDILSDVRVSVVTAEEGMFAFKELLGSAVNYFNFETKTVCRHPGYEKLYPEYDKAFFDTILANDEEIIVNRNTLMHFSEKSARNTIRNLKIAPEVLLTSELQNVIDRELPVIIVSAGPSLDKNIGELRRAKGHSLIICVDTAIKYMMQQDIMPDATIVIEPEKPAMHYSDPRTDAIPLICDIEANPEIVLKNRAPKILFNCRDFMARLMAKAGRSSVDRASGGSVATAAYAFAYQLGFKKIVLVGQDLAYAGEATHAGGVESAGINNEIGTACVDDVFGGKVRTRGDWIQYLKWFEKAIEVIRANNEDIEVIDATEGGALIHGSKVMTLKEVVDRYCTGNYDFESSLKGIGSQHFTGGNDSKSSLKGIGSQHFTSGNDSKSSQKDASVVLNSEKIIEVINDCPAALRRIARNSEKALRLCKNAIGMLGSANNGSIDSTTVSLLKEIEKYKSLCEEETVYGLLNNYAVAKIAEKLKEISGGQAACGEAGTKLLYLKKLEPAFEVMGAACDELREEFEKITPFGEEGSEDARRDSDKSPLVTVIVPVHNGGEFLVNCLSNIVNQTLSEIEIICVDDASTDSSPKVLAEFERQYPDKVKVLTNKESRGPGGARNAAIEIAKGEYIGFVDCDDQIDVTMYEKLYHAAKEKDADVVDCGFIGSVEKKPHLTTPAALCGKLDREKRLELCAGRIGYIWSKIFRRSIFIDNNIRMLEKIPSQDTIMLYYFFCYVNSVERCNEVLYVYRERPDSFSKRRNLDYMINMWKAGAAEAKRMMLAAPDGEYCLPALEFKLYDFYARMLDLYMMDPNENEVSKLRDMRDFMKDYKTAGDNRFIKNNMDKDILRLAKLNDADPMKLMFEKKKSASKASR